MEPKERQVLHYTPGGGEICSENGWTTSLMFQAGRQYAAG